MIKAQSDRRRLHDQFPKRERRFCCGLRLLVDIFIERRGRSFANTACKLLCSHPPGSNCGLLPEVLFSRREPRRGQLRMHPGKIRRPRDGPGEGVKYRFISWRMLEPQAESGIHKWSSEAVPILYYDWSVGSQPWITHAACHVDHGTRQIQAY